MIDIHTHILPHVDDGPTNLQQSLIILQQAAQQGITEMIATPHCFHPRYHVAYDVVNAQINLLRMELEKNNIDITVHAGHEIFLSENVLYNDATSQMHTLANSKYLLLELPNQLQPIYVKELFQKLYLKNIIPIIAHPERNHSFQQRPELLEQLVLLGAMTQISADSIVGSYGKTTQKFALALIRANIAHCYGSDVHNTTNRPLLFTQGLYVLQKYKLFDAIDTLLENNTRIVRNEPLLTEQPEAVGAYKRKQLFHW